MTGMLVSIGRFSAVEGGDGKLKVRPLTPVLDNFQDGMDVFLAGARPRWTRVAGIHKTDTGMTVGLADVGTREQALALVGYLIQIPKFRLVAPPEDTHYVSTLVGASVRTREGRVLGHLEEVLPGPANDFFLVRDERGREILLPGIRQIIVEIDPGRGFIIVDPWEGMVD